MMSSMPDASAIEANMARTMIVVQCTTCAGTAFPRMRWYNTSITWPPSSGGTGRALNRARAKLMAANSSRASYQEVCDTWFDNLASPISEVARNCWSAAGTWCPVSMAL